MKVYQTSEIKNIALIGSAGSGKTTLAESMLYEAGIIKRRGSVEAKNTVSDYFPVEQEYGYSVFSTVFHVEWNNKKLNIIDCPGSDDFVGGAITALNVTDQAVVLINGQYGPEVGTQNNFRYTEKLKKPVIFLVNQLDSDNLRTKVCADTISYLHRSWIQLAYRRAAHEEIFMEARGWSTNHRGYPSRGNGQGYGAAQGSCGGCRRERRRPDGEILRGRDSDRGRTARGYPQGTRDTLNIPRVLCLCR